MHFNLKVLNLLHSLCDSTSDTPSAFRDAGYEMHTVEPHFALSNNRECNPECVLVSVRAHDCLVVESKSGNGGSCDQLLRYQGLRVNDLLGAGLGLLPTTMRQASALLVVPHNLAETHLTRLQDLGLSIPLVAYDPEGGSFQLRRGTLSCKELHQALTAGICVRWPPTPHDYIPFDAESTDGEIAVEIVNSIIAQVLSRRKCFVSGEICRDAIRYWHVLHSRQKSCLAKRVERVIENLLVVGFTGQFRIQSKRAGFSVDVSPSALRAASTDRNGFARRLTSMGVEAIAALEAKLKDEHQSGQLGLYKGTVLPPLRRQTTRRKRRASSHS